MDQTRKGWMHIPGMLMISAAYLVLSYFLIGFRMEQLFLLAICNLLYVASPVTRRLLVSFAPFVVFWIIFDYMKAFPNYRYRDVEIESLYRLELKWFGIRYRDVRMTLNEFFATHHRVWADVIAGFFYLTWVPVPVALTIWLCFRDKSAALRLSVGFLVVNLVGFVVYYLLPAAPPWYVARYGFGFVPHTPGSAAGMLRADEALGIHLFRSMYEKSSNVFAAMPSLHAAYPVVALYYGIKNRLGWINAGIALCMAGIWWAAVYSGHHYVLDVLAGILCAVSGLFLWEKVRVLFGKKPRGQPSMKSIESPEYLRVSSSSRSALKDS